MAWSNGVPSGMTSPSGRRIVPASARWCFAPPFAIRSASVADWLEPSSAFRVTGIPWFATITTAFSARPITISANPGARMLTIANAIRMANEA